MLNNILSQLLCCLLAIGLLRQYLVIGASPPGKNPAILIEGCLETGCLNSLSQNYIIVSKCFDSLRETIPPDDDEYSLKLCCNVAKYESCIFPYIISFCGMDDLDKFDNELKSLNSMCGITTLQWSKCEVNKTQPVDNELELRE